MARDEIVIVDYGMGNIWSVQNALHYLGQIAILSDDLEVVSKAQTLILPGVGSFRTAMEALKKKGLDQAILEAVCNRESKILGICLGMQLMGQLGTEDGITEGLGLIPTRVERFDTTLLGGAKIPHIGFNAVYSETTSKLFSGLKREEDFYFVHSYRMMPSGLTGNVSTCRYGEEFVAAYEKDNVFATQFHPEKSQVNGLKLLKNFLSTK